MIPRIIIATLSGFIALSCRAAPPDGMQIDPNSAEAIWYRGLKQPDTGMGCCSLADCRPVDYRINGDNYEVFIEEKWVKVPPEKVLQKIDNPTGRAIACHAGEFIFCFVRPSET